MDMIYLPETWLGGKTIIISSQVRYSRLFLQDIEKNYNV